VCVCVCVVCVCMCVWYVCVWCVYVCVCGVYVVCVCACVLWKGGILQCKGSYLTGPLFYTDTLLLEENCILLGYCAASSGNFLSTFWDSRLSRNVSQKLLLLAA